jgi:hypothetical protein
MLFKPVIYIMLCLALMALVTHDIAIGMVDRVKFTLMATGVALQICTSLDWWYLFETVVLRKLLRIQV